MALVAESDQDFVPFEEVRRNRQMSESAIRRRMRARGVGLWIDPLDARRRLIRAEDVAVLFELRPAPHRARASSHASLSTTAH